MLPRHLLDSDSGRLVRLKARRSCARRRLESHLPLVPRPKPHHLRPPLQEITSGLNSPASLYLRAQFVDMSAYPPQNSGRYGAPPPQQPQYASGQYPYVGSSHMNAGRLLIIAQTSTTTAPAQLQRLSATSATSAVLRTSATTWVRIQQFSGRRSP